MDVTVNIWAVLVGMVVHMAIGFAWYAQGMFGKTWCKLMGWNMDTEAGRQAFEERQKKGMGAILAQAFVMAFLLSYILAHFVGIIEKFDGNPYQLPVWLWIGFIATVTYTDALFSRASKTLWVINALYPLVSMLVMTVIFVMWK